MLSDAKLRSLKPREKAYKVADRDGLYVTVLSSGVISFRYNYRINGRQETVVLGRFEPGGLMLAEARNKLALAKKNLGSGISPARRKLREKARTNGEQTLGDWFDAWLRDHKMADSTRDMRRSTFERDLRRPYGRLLMNEITHQDLRQLCDEIVARGAPSVAVHAREIVMLVYRHANERGHAYENPADLVRPCAIATFQPRDRSLTPHEIGLVFRHLESVATAATIRLALKLLLLTMLRKSELVEAQWSEISFSDALWTIPPERMKRRNPHLVYLSSQALDILVALKTCAGGAPYLLPSRYDPHHHMSKATLNQVTRLVSEEATAAGDSLALFCPHDFRRTASTLLHEAGYQSDWIEKCLAHEQRGVRAVYNKAEYGEQRRKMLQDWADMIDSWCTRG